jgi:hypothetical protein
MLSSIQQQAPETTDPIDPTHLVLKVCKAYLAVNAIVDDLVY